MLALQRWRLQNGELPKSLDELVGEMLDALPVDPFTGEPFRYFPDGVAGSSSRSYFAHGTEIAPGTPLIWSPGRDLEKEMIEYWRDNDTDTGFESVGEIRWQGSNGVSISDREAISQGWTFPILSSE